MVRELLQLRPWIRYPICKGVKSVILSSFSDASHPKDRSYGQSGIICGIRASGLNEEDTYHIIDWASHRQKRVSYSSYGAEILACATADDRGYYLREAMRSIFPDMNMRHELTIDSNALQETITTLREGTEYRLRPTVQRIRDSFEAGELNVIRWIPGTLNVADALTKRNIALYEQLNDMCADGKMKVDLNQGIAVDGDTWK